MFFHSRIVQGRALAIVFFAAAIGIGCTFWDTGILVLVIFVPAMPVVAGIALWIQAPKLPPNVLPSAATWIGPNCLPLRTRIINVLVSILLMGYGTYSVLIGDFYIPSKRGPGTHFHGISVWIPAMACLCVVINLMATVVDHYDKRNNELIYAHVDTGTQWIGWSLFCVTAVLMFLQQYSTDWQSA